MSQIPFDFETEIATESDPINREPQIAAPSFLHQMERLGLAYDSFTSQVVLSDMGFTWTA